MQSVERVFKHSLWLYNFKKQIMNKEEFIKKNYSKEYDKFCKELNYYNSGKLSYQVGLSNGLGGGEILTLEDVFLAQLWFERAGFEVDKFTAEYNMQFMVKIDYAPHESVGIDEKGQEEITDFEDLLLSIDATEIKHRADVFVGIGW